MNITVQQGEIQKRADAAVVVNLFEGTKPGGATAAIDKALDGLVSTVLKSGDFTGKKNQISVHYTNLARCQKESSSSDLGNASACR